MDQNQPNQYINEVRNLFRNIAKNYKSYVFSQVSPLDFTVPQVTLLHELYHHPNITLKEVSELMGLAKSTTCGIVDRLVQKGFVIRTVDPEDRRTVKLSLSPQINDLNATFEMIRTDYFYRVLKNLSESDIKEIINALQKINTAMNKTRGEKCPDI